MLLLVLVFVLFTVELVVVFIVVVLSSESCANTEADANDANTATIVTDLFMYFPLDLCEDKNASADTDDD